MANYVQPTEYINYVSEFKKIFVNRNNAPTNQIFKIDSNISDEYYFQIVNKNNRIVSLSGRSFQIYGSLEDAKNIQHILFYTPSATIETFQDEYGNIKAENVLHFHINTYNQEYLAQIKTNKQANITIVETTGGDTQVVLRDVCLCYKRPYIDNVVPAEIYTVRILTGSLPWQNEFGAGQNINLVEGAPNFAFGSNLSTASNQFVVGDTNTPDGTKAFIVANSGNVFTVDYNGNVQAGAISASNIFISGQNFNEIVDGKIDELSTAIENIPTYSADNVTIQMNENNQFSIKSLETKLHAGLNVTLITDEAGNTTINAIDNSGQTILYYPGEGLSLVSTTFSVDKNWLDNKIVANVSGDFNSTSTWVTNNFEDKTDAFNTHNALEAKINNLSANINGKIDDISSFVSGLPDDIAVKANETEVQYISSFVSGLPQDINDIISAMNQKADKNALIELSGTVEGLAETKADLSALNNVDAKFANYSTTETIVETYATKDSLEDYAQTSAIPTGNAQLENTANYITLSSIPTYTGVAPIVVDAETHEISLDGDVGETYTAGFGLALDEHNEFTLTGTVLQGDESTIHIENNTISVIGGTGGEGKEYGAGEGLALSGNGLSTFVLTAHIPTTVAELTDSSNYALKSELIDSEDVSGIVEDMSATIIDGLATEGFVTGQGYQTATNVSDYFASVSGDIVTAATGAITVPTNEQISGIAEDVVESLSTTIRSGLATEGYVTGLGYQTAQDVTDAISASSGAIFNAATGAIPTDLSAFSNEHTQYVKRSEIPEGAIYYAGNGLELVANDPEDPSSPSTTFTLTAQIPDGESISGAASAVVEGLSTTIREGLATTDQLIDTEDVSGIVQSMSGAIVDGLATEGDITTAISSSSGAIVTAATEAIVVPTKVSELINDVGYLSAITSADIPSEYVTDTELETALSEYTKTVDLNIPTNDAITGLAKDYVDTLNLATTYAAKSVEDDVAILKASSGDFNDYYTKIDVNAISTALSSAVSGAGYLTEVPNTYALKSDLPTKISDLTNDSQFATSANVSAIVTGFGYITDSALDYEGVSPISVSNDHKISIDTSGLGKTYTGVDGIKVDNSLNEISLTATIPTSATISSIASAVTDSFVAASGVYTGTGLMIDEIDNTLNVVLSAANDSNMIVDVDQDGVIWLSSIAQGGGGVEYTSLTPSLLAIDNTNHTLSAATQSGGGGGGSNDLSEYNNDVGFITNEDLTVRQRVVTNTTTFAPYIEIYQNEYTPQTSAITLSAFDVDITDLPTSASVATFEEWVYTATPITGITLDASISANLLGDLPTSYTSSCYYVFVRRIVNVGNNTTQQFISFAYEFPKTV